MAHWWTTSTKPKSVPSTRSSSPNPKFLGYQMPPTKFQSLGLARWLSKIKVQVSHPELDSWNPPVGERREQTPQICLTSHVHGSMQARVCARARTHTRTELYMYLWLLIFKDLQTGGIQPITNCYSNSFKPWVSVMTKHIKFIDPVKSEWLKAAFLVLWFY